MAENLKKIVNYAAKYGVLVIFINQLREKIGVMFGNPETTPGGKALKYNASIRIRIGGGKAEKNDIYHTDPDGNKVLMGRKATVSLWKNRFAKPYRGDPLEIKVWFEQYFPNIDDIIFNVARQLKIVMPYKSEFRWSKHKVAVEGAKEFMEAIKMRGLLKDLVDQIVATASEKEVILPPEMVQYLEENPASEGDEGGDDLSDDAATKEVDAEELVKDASDDDDGDDTDEESVEKPARRKRTSKASAEGE
jgi:recombination protein RecA